MVNWFRKALSLENDKDPSFITLVRTVLTIATIGGVALSVFQVFQVKESNDWAIVFAIAIIAVLAGISLFLSYRNIIWPGKLLLPATTLVAVTFITINGNGMHDSAMVGFPIALIFAGLLLGQKALPFATAFTILGVWTVAYFDLSGINVTEIAKQTGIDDVIIISTLQVIAASSLNSLMKRLNRAVGISKANEQAQIETNQELRDLQSTLEERIQERTYELSNRAIQFKAIAQISKVIIDAKGELNILLPRIANIIGEQFNFYHVGIFLLDERNEYALLRATNNRGKQNVVTQEHKVPVDRGSIVGIAASTGNYHIALDAGDNAVSFNYPDLPDTRSELALPMRSGEKIIGVLDIHSSEQNAFGSDEAEVLSVLADQVTIAIEVAQQFEETQRSLAETERVYQQYVRQEYNRLVKSQPHRGFVYKETEVKPFDKPLQNAEIIDAIQSGDIHKTEKKRGTRLAAPIKLRGQVIGTLNIGTNGGQQPNTEDIEIITAVADRLALALENARLLEDAQHRAAKERTISEGAARVSAALDVESILRTTADELERTLGGSEVIIQLESEE